MSKFPSDSELRTVVNHVVAGEDGRLRLLFGRQDLWLGTQGRRGSPLREAWDKCKSNQNDVLRLLVEQGWDVTAERFDAEAERVVVECLERGPRWRQDAREQGVLEVRIYLSRGWGLSFVPGDLRCPVRYGGSYDGHRPVTPAHALEEIERDLDSNRREMAQTATWFQPFLEKMEKKKGFRLSSVIDKIEDSNKIVRV